MRSDPIDTALERFRDLLALAQEKGLLDDEQVRGQLLAYGQAVEHRKLEKRTGLVGFDATLPPRT